MAQSAFSSRILDLNRNGLAAADVDVWVFNAGPPMIYASNLAMSGGTNLLTTDAYSHAWYYEDKGIGTSLDIDRQTDVDNTNTTTVLTNGSNVAPSGRRCAEDANSVVAFKELENTGGSSFANPAVDVNSGNNAEGQVSISVQNVQRRDGRVVAFSMRTSIALGGGAETAFLAKLRFPKPHAKPVGKFPMPVLRAAVVGRR